MITRLILNTTLESNEKSAIKVITIGDRQMVQVIAPESRLEWLLTLEQLNELVFKGETYLQDNGVSK